MNAEERARLRALVTHPSSDRAERAEARRLTLALLDEVDRLTEARLTFSGRLGFGDGKTEPAATLEEMLDPIEQAFSDAHEHAECPVVCEPCGETLASTTCERCYGSGCGPGTASGAYSECEWCAGVGRVHVGCAEQSYADLVTRAERAEADLTQLRTGIQAVIDDRYAGDFNPLIPKLAALLQEPT